MFTLAVSIPNIQQLSLVIINYDLPTNCENYLYRCVDVSLFLLNSCLSTYITTNSLTVGRINYGRGRFGSKGVAINFVTGDDVRAMRDIEQFYGTHIDEMPMNVADLI